MRTTLTARKKHWTRNRARITGALSLVLLAGCASSPPPAPSLDKAAVRAEVMAVIRENPQLLIDTLTDYQRAQALARQQADEQAMRARIAQIDWPAAVADSPTRGAPARQFLLFEFADFQCPFCARANDGLRQFADAHRDEITLVYKHLPLTEMHPEAERAARAAWAAQQQGRFWEYHDALFARQTELKDATFTAIARELGLDIARFERDRGSDAAARAIQKDLALARQLQVSGTPFFLLGGEPLAGALPRDAFEQVFSRLKRAASADAGTSH